jgi:hypothetical protein
MNKLHSDRDRASCADDKAGGVGPQGKPSLCRLRLYQVVWNYRAQGRACRVHTEQHSMKHHLQLWPRRVCSPLPDMPDDAPRPPTDRQRSPWTEHTTRASLVMRAFSEGQSEWTTLARTYPRGQEHGLVAYREWIEALGAVRAYPFLVHIWVRNVVAWTARSSTWVPPLSSPGPSGSGMESYFPLAPIAHFFPTLPPKSLAGDGCRRCHQPQAVGFNPTSVVGADVKRLLRMRVSPLTC